MGLVKAYQDWKSQFRPENQHVKWAVEAFETGFIQIRKSDAGENRTAIHWSEIKAVYAYKRDCFAVDQINLALEFEDGTSIQISENDEGYTEFLKALPTGIDGFPAEQEWWEKVALPPFATNWTCLFQRSAVKQH
jgi:hypothetical protein